MAAMELAAEVPVVALPLVTAAIPPPVAIVVAVRAAARVVPVAAAATVVAPLLFFSASSSESLLYCGFAPPVVLNVVQDSQFPEQSWHYFVWC